MPTDPLIPLGVKLPNIATPQEVAQQGLDLQDKRLELQKRQQELAKAARAQGEQDAVNKLYVTSADPTTGKIDPQQFLGALAKNGLGHLVPTYQKSFDEAATAAATSAEKQALAKKAATDAQLSEADYFGAMGAKIQASGYDPVIAHSELDAAQASGHDVTPLQSALKQMPLNRAIDMMVQGSAKQRELLAREASEKASAAAANATAAHLNAETAGTIPETPAQKATRLFAEAKFREEQRHNRATEAAANPFGALLGSGGSAPISGGSAIAGGVTSPTPSGPQTPTTAPNGIPTTKPDIAPGSLAPGKSLPAWQDENGVHGAAFIAQLPPNIRGEVQAYAEGRRPFPTGMSYAKLQPLIALVSQYDPSFDAGNYNARNKTRTDLTSTNGTGGKQINALNTAIGHLEELSKAAEALKNGDVQGYNQFTNWFKTQFTGWTGKTDFDTIAPKVADEVETLWRQGGGTEHGVETTLKSLNSNMAQGQLKSAISETGKLIESKLSSLEQMRDQALGPFGGDIKVIFPKSREVLTALQNNGKDSSSAPKEGTEGTVGGKPAVWRNGSQGPGWYAK